ncbi:MAG: non-canonical purine NTP diphosphatase [Tenuifilum sp.]|uniref:non-canonical purine NTP diphosphatase n=1 Tax=Tenuifilum sp. TaxID=2760880 RepID=UPI001B4064B9|nr:non-canonical purine NTP diphosphatase [Bacteroidales bacterium]HOK60465.1 non-canonical purine NTP diphosphatase [Tenuifilum sp.]MBP9028124.1 non-canonical purine NTP diphosphatase [Bacteroidales bacterium]HOK85058.1 non-canonical purine NTP diphosphatase [Tenuifilum sp.]HON71083.1 non-canonical purine NTP diphosphatase [Tenuifilum sp.]
MAGSSFSLVFATNNPHKLKEVQHALGDRFTLVTLNAVGITDEIPEEYGTLQDNALQKARYVYNKTGQNCFADDTGLEVEALNWEPGVYSARYAGDAKKPKDNIRKLLSNLKGVENRKARFRTVIALILNGEEYLFEGVVWGKIIDQERGADGFGYDPIFVPDGFTETFAEMPLSLKNQISHRGKAVEELCKFLKSRF